MAQPKRSHDHESIRLAEEAHELTHHGVPGLKRNSGYLDEEWHPKLRGTLARKKYREMEDNSPVIGASLWIIEALSRQATWTHEENPSGHPLAQAGVEFSEECFGDMETPWKMHLAEALSVVTYGWCAMVPSFKIRRGSATDPMLHSKHNDGKIGWRDWEPRGQETIERWVFDDRGAWLSTGRLLGMIQRDPNTGRMHPIPLDRMLLFRNRPRKNNPEGRSALRTCWRPYYKGMMLEDIMTIGIERNVAGLPDYQVPADVMKAATAEAAAARTAALTLVKKARLDQYFGIVRPSETDTKGQATGYKFQLLSSSGRSFANALPVVQHFDLRIFQNFLTEFMQLGQGSSSTSYSAHSDKTNLLGMAIDALLDMVDDVTNEQALPWLFELNGFPQEARPTRKHTDIEKRDVASLLGAVSQAVSSGAMEGEADVNNFCRSLIDLDPSEARPLGSMLQDAALGANALGAIQTQPAAAPVAAQPAVDPVTGLPIEAAAPTTEPEPDPGDDGPDYWTLEEAAEALRVSPQRLRNAVKRGQLPGASVGNTIRLKRANVEALFESGQL
jgi:excisionase family DNA binding protein